MPPENSFTYRTMNPLLIDLDLLKQQKQELVNLLWDMPEGDLRDALNGILHLLDAVQDGIEDNGNVELIGESI